MPALCFLDDFQYLFLSNTILIKVQIHDECWLWIIMFIDLLEDNSLKLSRNRVRFLLPIGDGISGRDAGLVFVSASTRLSVDFGYLYFQGAVRSVNNAIRKSLPFR